MQSPLQRLQLSLDRLRSRRSRSARPKFLRAKRQRHFAEHMMDAVINSVTEAVIAFDTAGKITHWNVGAEQLFGYSSKEVIGRDADLLVAPLGFVPRGEGPRGAFDGVINGQNFTGDTVRAAKNGTVIYVNVTANRIMDDEGNTLGVCAVMRDIRDRKGALEKLSASEARFRGLFEHSLAPIVIRDCEGQIEQCNKAFRDLLGYSQDEIIGLPYSRLLPPDCQMQADDFARSLVADSSLGFQNEGALVHKLGHRIWVRRVISGLPNPGDSPKIFTVCLDITDARKSMAQLQESERRLHYAMHATGGGVWDWDLDKQEAWWSENMYSLWGVEPGTSMNEANPAAIVHEDDRAEVRRAIADCISSRSDYNHEFRIRHSQRGILWMASTGRLVDSKDGGARLVGMSFDITAQKSAEQAIKEKAALAVQLAKIADAAPGVICSFKQDQNGKFSVPYASDNMKEVYGLDPRSVRDSADAIFQRVHPEDVPHVLDSISISAKMLSTWHDSFRFDHPTKGIIWIEGFSSPEPQPDGSVIWHGMVHDVTDRKAAEIVLSRLRKVSDVSALAGGIAHDINNVLTVITGNLYLLQSEIGLEKVSERVASAIDAATAAASLNHRLLRLSRKDLQVARIVDLNERVNEVGGLLDRILGSRIRLKMELSGGPLPVRADPGELDSAILNLAVNARDAICGAGTITVRTTQIEIDEAAAGGISPNARNGEFVTLAITDTGAGMTQEVLKKAGEPLFTTKADGRGTGLGLFSVFSFTRHSEGFVVIDSRVNQGTTVTLYLPVIRDHGIRPTQRIIMGSRQRLLVVEDRDDLRRVTQARLEALGYVTVGARDALEAQLLLATSGKFDAVLSDVVMPGEMNGYQLSNWIAQNFVGLPVLLTSGYEDDALVSAGIALPTECELLRKPYTQEALSSAVYGAVHSVPNAVETSR